MTSSSATTGYLGGGQDMIAEFEGSGVSSDAAPLRVQIPELLIAIFKAPSKATLAALARVCRAWSEIALDILWDDGLQSAIPLFEILTPGIKLGGPWSDSLNDADWDRFRQYANQVRCLNHTDPDEATGQPQRIDDHYLACLPYAKPPDYGPLLPRLRYLGWSVSNDLGGFAALKEFLPPSLKELYIASSCETQTPEEVELIMSLIADQPGIHLTHWTHLNILSSQPNVENVLIKYLRDQLDLVSLRLGFISAAGKLAAELPRHRKLQDIQLMAFFDTEQEVQSFCSCLSDCSPSLTRIDLRLGQGGIGIGSPLPFHPLRPLLKLGSLTRVTLNYAGEMNFNQADVVAMGEAWPLVHDLDLSWQAIQESKIPVSLLTTFARSFGPALATLRVQVSFEATPTFTSPPTRFLALRNIHFGASKISQVKLEGVANFLSSILPVGITIQATEKPEETKIWTDLRALVQSLHTEGPVVTQDQLNG